MTTLGPALASSARHNPGRLAILDGRERFTWASFCERVARAAGVLSQRGVRRGQRFAIYARNGRRFDELKWAGFWLGAVPVPINWRLAPPEIAHILEDSAVCLIAVEDEFAGAFDDGALAAWSDRLLGLPDAYEAALAQAAPAALAKMAEDDDAILLYTGGTTGRAKGVRLSHRNIISNALAFGLGAGARRDDIYLHVAPMFHSADLLGTAWFLLGAGHAYLPDFSPGAFLEAIERYKVSATVVVPAILMATLSHPEITSYDVSSLRLLGYGAAPMAYEWIERTARAFPRGCLANTYGLTETAPDLTIFAPAEFLAAIDSGDRTGIVTSAGELWARGPNIMTGYLNLPKETEAALHRHPDVSEAAVVGLPDERLGEVLFAAIVPVPGKTLGSEALIEHCRALIGGYKIPRRMAFVEALTRSALGKVLKAELRDIYAP
ncbi:MAG: class I adenylate-forming enzyme family protein [Alphaproteobacteria bacterium]